MGYELEGESGANPLGRMHVGVRDGGRGSFAGRRREIDLLRAALEQAGEGQGRLVLLSGGRGIGKTRTATELAKQAKHRGVAVLWARCTEAGPRFGPWKQILEQCVHGLEESLLRELLGDSGPEIAAVVPAIRDRLGIVREDEAPQIRSDLFASILVRLLAEVARRAPLAVVLDDLEDADSDSLSVLELLARRLGDLPLLVLATYCEDGLATGHPLFDALGELVRAPATEHVDLRGLSLDEITQLVAGAVGVELTGRAVATLSQCTGGSPLFVLELLRGLGTEGLRDLSENGLRTVPLTPDVRSVVSRRLSSLCEPCRCGLRVAAMVGYHFPAALVAAVVAEQGGEDDRSGGTSRCGDIESIDAFLEEGIGANVVRPMCEAPGCYRFSDWFIMNALRHEVPVAERAGLQRRIARALDREGKSIPCMTEWAFRGMAGRAEANAASAGVETVCLGHCEAASLFANERPRLGERSAEETPAVIAAKPPRSGALRKEGDYWTVRFGRVAEQLKESRGLVYLSHLLRHPRRAFLAVEIVALSPGPGRSEPSNGKLEPSALREAFSSSAEPVMDAQARAACRARLADLREELAEAESHNDLDRAERVRDEVEQLSSFWQASLGLGGRTRSISSSVMERARSAVTKRIRAEIVRIAEVNGELGRHLAVTIVTGQVCSYQPDRDAAVDWDL